MREPEFLFLPPGLPSPEWLTAVLVRGGHLPEGRVIGVESRDSGAFNSSTSFLRLSYADETPPGVPLKLVLKRNIPEPWGVEAGAVEVGFYKLVAARPGHPPVTPPCYAAAYEPASGSSYLLLQDISDTHGAPITRDQQVNIVEGVPAETDIEAVIATPLFRNGAARNCYNPGLISIHFEGKNAR